ncbi:DNA-3-methyladenine glycosylase 2 family protein [Streptomyces sp. NP160]|nr:DNA-3-methyladenine glycosylase 2 family protein [Streptomyces sp. NP160]
MVWEPTRPTDLALTLSRLQHGRRDPTHQTSPDGVVWRTLNTAAGPATLALHQHGRVLTCRAWGPGAEPAVAAAPALLGGEDDPTGFEPRHPVLAAAHHRFPGLRLARTGDVFEALVGAVLSQRVEGTDANAAWTRLVTDLGAPTPGPAPPGMRVFPSARAWAGLDQAAWRRAGVDVRRAATVQAAARVQPALERLAGRSGEQVDAALRTLQGVGAWTAAEVRQRALGDADAVSVGDFHLAAITGQVLAGRPFDDAEMVEHLQPWRPHRHRVARLLYALGIESLPRRAPRRPRA